MTEVQDEVQQVQEDVVGEVEGTLKEEEVLRSHSRDRASLACSRPRLSPSIPSCSSSREEASSWLSNRAATRDSFSALGGAGGVEQSSGRDSVTMGT